MDKDLLQINHTRGVELESGVPVLDRARTGRSSDCAVELEPGEAISRAFTAKKQERDCPKIKKPKGQIDLALVHCNEDQTSDEIRAKSGHAVGRPSGQKKSDEDTIP
jgi:hypothetical protein